MEILALIFFALGGLLDGYRDYWGQGFYQHYTSIHNPTGGKSEKFIDYICEYYYAKKRIRWLWGLIDIPLDRWHNAKWGAYACFALGAYLLPTWEWALIGWVIVRPPFQNTLHWSLIYKKFTVRGW